jgi:aerobic-type carbon monoxide dehydrogenase small subunit (CoxS/CutS family)
MDRHEVTVTINGRSRSAFVPARTLLSDFIRHTLALPGTHVGCEHGVCGACTVLIDGVATRSCLTFAVQADGTAITTIEGLAKGGEMSPLQHAFWEEHGLQCGFCTPGMLMVAEELLKQNPNPTDADIREAIAGNLCRCTGYEYIIAAIRSAAAKLRGEAAAPAHHAKATELETA